jgi:SET domain-containing protein
MAVCEVQKSPIHGNGVFATENIAAEVTLFETHVRGAPDGRALRHKRKFFVSVDIGDWVNISPNCQYNHSKKNTNCRSETRGRFKFLVTLREIQKGEELLVDFTLDTDLEQPREGWSE